MNPKRTIIFLNHKYQSASAGQLDQLLPGNVPGVGLFETMRVYRNVLLFWPEHYKRWEKGLGRMRLKRPGSAKTILTIVVETIRRNQLAHGRVRLMTWQYQGRQSLAVVPRALRLKESLYQQGYQAVLSSVRRKRHPYTHLKTLAYGLFRESLKEAQTQGADEGILLNGKGEVVETSRANLFFMRKGILATPAVHCGCLNGITRAKVIGLARQVKLPCRRGIFYWPDLLKAEEIFITNAFMGIMPIVALNRKKIGSGYPGPVTQRLRSLYRQMLEQEYASQKRIHITAVGDF